ncbi:hypothetical protein [Lacinutrix sp.]|uniref:hypothetical protein n=1 Tax=Lacinutrix sp. TaxID=1937692 RepID=UPI0025C29B1A|nr:hypothetical protein [Lacinutrix sp.]
MKNIRLIGLLFILIVSCSDIIGVEDISDKTVTILAPTEAAMLNETTVIFSWNTLEDTERYKLQIVMPDFENTIAILEDTTITATSFSKVISAGNYEWRIRAENSDFQTAYTTQSFSVTQSDAVDISNETVVLLAPTNAIIFTTTDTINFSWETVLNTETYTVQIATPSFANAVEIIENEVVSTTGFSVSNIDAQDYEWRVKAQNSDYETTYTTQSFSVEE